MKRQYSVLDNAKRIWFITGTFATNSAADYFVPVRVLFPDEITDPTTKKIMTFSGFKEKFCQRGYSGFGQSYTGVKNAKKLRDIVNRRFFARSKTDVGMVEKARYHSYEVSVDNITGALFHELDQLWGVVAGAKSDTAALTAFKQAAGFKRNTVEKDSPLIELGITKAKALLPELANRAVDRKLVIFCSHTDVYNLVIQAFGRFAVGINGSVAKSKREELCQRFQTDPGIRVFVGNIQAASEGITLTAASEMWFIETGYSPMLVKQAVGRIDRYGQEAETCDVHIAVVNHPLDKRVTGIITRKAQNLSKVNKSAKLEF